MQSANIGNTMADIIDGNFIAKSIHAELTEELKKFEGTRKPCEDMPPLQPTYD